jgi:hypothetical protein
VVVIIFLDVQQIGEFCVVEEWRTEDYRRAMGKYVFWLNWLIVSCSVRDGLRLTPARMSVIINKRK